MTRASQDLRSKYSKYGNSFGRRQKAAQLRKEREAAGEKDSGFVPTIFGRELLKFPVGETEVRFLPALDPEKNFAVRLEVRWLEHPGVGGGKGFSMPVATLRQFGKHDFYDEERWSIWRSIHDDTAIDDYEKKRRWEEFKRRRANRVYFDKTQYYALGLPQGGRGPGDWRPSILAKTLFALLDDIPNTKRGGDFTNPLTGFPVVVKKQPKSGATDASQVEYTAPDYTMDEACPLGYWPGEGVHGPKIGSDEWVDAWLTQDPDLFGKLDTIMESIPDVHLLGTQDFHWGSVDDGLLYTNNQICAMIQGADPQVFRRENAKEFSARGSVEDRPIEGYGRLPQPGGQRAQEQNQDQYDRMQGQDLNQKMQQRGVQNANRFNPQQQRQQLREMDRQEPPREAPHGQYGNQEDQEQPRSRFAPRQRPKPQNRFSPGQQQNQPQRGGGNYYQGSPQDGGGRGDIPPPDDDDMDKPSVGGGRQDFPPYDDDSEIPF